MIKNERQYRITKAQVGRFRKALLALPRRAPKDVHPVLFKAQREALESQLNDLLSEASQYEALRNGKKRGVRLDSIEELPRALICARVAKGLTQRQLAERLGLKEQQVQRYEASEYATASWQRIRQVVHALGLRLKERVLLDEVSA
jgi:ribosome-binding protein aMBF1 (putative translation factor)